MRELLPSRLCLIVHPELAFQFPLRAQRVPYLILAL